MSETEKTLIYIIIENLIIKFIYRIGYIFIVSNMITCIIIFSFVFIILCFSFFCKINI